jgi:hypothetical protein
VTVDRSFVLASGGMDRHLAYVAMTRHRAQAALYAGRCDFKTYGAMVARLSRRRAKETTLDFAERRGIDTLRDWIENGRALLNGVRGRFEQAIDRIGKRLGLDGWSLRQEHQQARQVPTAGERLQERPAGIEAAPTGTGAASGGITPAARWKAAVETEVKEVRTKARRIADKAKKHAAALTQKLNEIERTAPTRPSGLSALFSGAKARYEGLMSGWTKERNRLVRARDRARRREAMVREFSAGDIAGYPNRAAKLAEQKAARRYSALAQTIQAEQEKQREQRATALRLKLEKQPERERSRGR